VVSCRNVQDPTALKQRDVRAEVELELERDVVVMQAVPIDERVRRCSPRRTANSLAVLPETPLLGLLALGLALDPPPKVADGLEERHNVANDVERCGVASRQQGLRRVAWAMGQGRRRKAAAMAEVQAMRVDGLQVLEGESGGAGPGRGARAMWLRHDTVRTFDHRRRGIDARQVRDVCRQGETA
jgi:hypothetical protein